MLRMASRSKYDHVAVLVKYKSGQVVLFESLHGKGVCRWDWKHLIANGMLNNYTRITYRKLCGIDRDEEFREVVNDFIDKTDGNPYRLNIGKLFFNNQTD
jgi:hypothetical protein